MPPRKGTKRTAPVEEPLIEEIDIVDEDEEARDKMPSPKKAPAKGKGKAAKAKTPKAKAKTPKAAPAAKKSKKAVESEDEEAGSETEFEVERIIDMKILKGVETYEVKWKGFPNSRNTWEPAENLTQCGDLLETFKAKLEKDNISRARRVSTMNSTKSSSTSRQPSVTRNATTPGTTSRVTRSRSRTPARRINVPIAQSSSNPQGKSRQSSVQRVMDAGLSKNLEKLKASRSKSEPKKRESGRPSSSKDQCPSKQKPAPSKSQKPTASKQSGNGNVNSLQPKSSGRGRRRLAESEENIEGPSLLGKAAKYCTLGAAAVSAGLGALFYTNPQAVDWTYMGEQARILFENLQGGDVPGTAGTV